jgi:hypothetical protein
MDPYKFKSDVETINFMMDAKRPELALVMSPVTSQMAVVNPRSIPTLPDDIVFLGIIPEADETGGIIVRDKYTRRVEKWDLVSYDEMLAKNTIKSRKLPQRVDTTELLNSHGLHVDAREVSSTRDVKDVSNLCMYYNLVKS